jgi:PAS domain S-box-containing protein
MARLRVLLLEDSPADAELALAALAAAGLDCAADVALARADFERLYAADRYDVVLADYNLPDYTGLDALARVRAADGLQPFILVSGALGEERAVEALRAGITDFVLKGNLNRLGPAVERALQESGQRREHLATQRALELSERRYRAIVEDQSELIIRMLPDLTVTFVNGAYCRYFGRTQEQMLGKSLLEHMRPQERANAQRFLAAIAPPTPALERDALVVDAGGAERWMHWAACDWARPSAALLRSTNAPSSPIAAKASRIAASKRRIVRRWGEGLSIISTHSAIVSHRPRQRLCGRCCRCCGLSGSGAH